MFSTAVMSTPAYPCAREGKLRRDRCSKKGYPSRHSWQLHKGTILALYQPQTGLALKEIVELMREDYHFVATEAMYKTRLRRWDARRYRKPGIKLPGPLPQTPLLKTPASGHNADLPMTNAKLRAPPEEETPLNENADPAVQICLYAGDSGQWNQAQQSSQDVSTMRDQRMVRYDASSSSSSENLGFVTTGGPYILTPTESVSSGGDSRPRSINDDYRALLDVCPMLTMPATKPEPRTFVNLCLKWCMLHSEGSFQAADSTAIGVFQTYSQLVEQRHRHSLTCVNSVLIMLLMYDKTCEAIDLLWNLRRAALQHKFPDHPLIRTIDYMIFQANGEFCMSEASQLRTVYNSFSEKLSPRHPHSLVAGYELAWRLAVDSKATNDQWEAIQLLGKLQTDSDETLGPTHMQSIAVLMTKVRVLQGLRMVSDALRLMSEAMDRIQVAYSPQHPYLLEARRRFAPLLFSAYRDDEAGDQWSRAALGNVELFGRKHPFSRESIQRFEDFLYTTNRKATEKNFVRNWWTPMRNIEGRE